jgi:hypothetical protein
LVDSGREEVATCSKVEVIIFGKRAEKNQKKDKKDMK